MNAFWFFNSSDLHLGRASGGYPRPHPGLQDHKGRRPAALALEPIAVRPDAYCWAA